MHTLTIKDLSVHHELDGQAMSAVRGGDGNQANGIGQANGLGMLTMANVGNGSLIKGPATIQSDNTFDQHAYNTSYSANGALLSISGLPFPGAMPLV